MQKHFPLLKEYARIKHDMDAQANEMAMSANADLEGGITLGEPDAKSTPPVIEQVEEADEEDEQAVIDQVVEGGIVDPTGDANSVQVASKAKTRN